MEQIFLEPNEEITSVIDKLASASGGKVAVVVPKNSTLFQSLVNLKLLAKQAKELNKDVVLITGNKVGQRLAAQVGIETYATLGTIKDTPQPAASAAAPKQAAEESERLPDGTPIRRYTPPATTAQPLDPEPVSNVPAPVEEPPQAEPAAVPVVPIPPTQPTVVAADEPVSAAPAPDDLPPIISRAPTERREFHFQLPWKSLVAAGVLLLLAFGITYVLLPKATLTVTLPAKAVSDSLDVSVRSIASADDLSVTGNLLSVEKSLTKPIAATGKKDIGTKASGTIGFRNCEDTQSHAIAAGSKVTSAGKTFTTNAAITIPPGSFSGGGTVCNSSSVNVAVTAEGAGETYNITNGTFAITGKSTRISGSGTTSGGTTKQVTVLMQEDIDAGLAELEKRASEEAAAELSTKAAGQTIIAGGIAQTIKTRSSDKKVGDQTDGATVTLVATLTTIAFDKAAVEAKLQEALTKKIDEGQRLEIPESTPPVLTFKEFSEDTTVLVVNVAGDGFGVPDVGKGELAAAVKHRSRSAAEARLKDQYKATEVKIDLSPSWWFDRLPVLSGAITVEYGFDEATPAQEPEAEANTP